MITHAYYLAKLICIYKYICLYAREKFYGNRSRFIRAMRNMIGKISSRLLILIKFCDLSSMRQNLTRKCSHLHNTACGSIQDTILGLSYVTRLRGRTSNANETPTRNNLSPRDDIATRSIKLGK